MTDTCAKCAAVSETERVVRNLEPRTRLVETWWVEDGSGPHPTSFGSDEASCRAHQAKRGGELQVVRLWETTVGQIVALCPTSTGPTAPQHVVSDTEECWCEPGTIKVEKS